ncbi:MAG: ABC transporter permease [Bacilli bacterium]|nr:ABC transporter permease [Bacilli bacterium]
MFWHNFKYSLKVLFKSKVLIFWTFAFPILMGIFFNLAFSDIENSEKLDVIDIAVVKSDEFDKNIIFKEAFESLSDSDDKLFDIDYTNLDKAKQLLEDDKITGYLVFNDDINIVVSSSGINETILKYVVNEISSNAEMINTLAANDINNEIEKGNYNINYEEIYAGAYALVSKDTAKLHNISNKNLSYTMIEYYTLIAMACLYGGILSMYIINYKLANMNSVGKRTAISPVHRGQMLVSSLLASYVVQLICVAILFVFTIFVLNVDYGDNLPMIILLALAGSLAGLSLGVIVATLIKANENAKTGILIAITMLGCFLSGMMGITMKYIVDTNVPLVNMINPASMITDGFYALYYYSTLDRFIFDIVSLLVFSILLIFISYFGLRRQKYDSI